MSPVEILVERLHAKRNGKGWMAKCPAHDDRTPSLSIDEGEDGRALLKCHAGCENAAILDTLGLTIRDLFPERSTPTTCQKRGRGVLNPGCVVARDGKTYLSIDSSPKQRTTLRAIASEQGAPMSQHSDKPATNWGACVDAATDKILNLLAKLRGYSPEFFQWLRANKLIGVYNRHIAFPVHDHTGKVIGVHYKVGEDWRYAPIGTKTAAWIIGELTPSDPVHVFESQWDAFAYMDVSGERSNIIITRGSGNGGLVAGLFPTGAMVYLWTQNDKPDPKTGKVPAEKWQEKICASVNVTVKRVTIPAPHKDLNDWTRAGATADDLIQAIIGAETVKKIQRLTVLTPDEILALPRDEHACIMGDRLLAKGQSLVIAGQPGLGKSKLALQFAFACNTGRDFCGLVTHGRGLRWLLLQTENSVARLQEDLAALKKWAGSEFDQSLLHLQVIRSDEDGFLCLDDNATVARISNTIQVVQPDGVIADPLRDFGVGNLDSDADMIATLRELSRLVRLGNPDRALVILHHALTGRAGIAKAFGLERAGFARNSKALLGWTRAQINIIPGREDSNEVLVLTCGKNSNGKEFPPVAVQRNGEGIYEVAEDFDIDQWRQEIGAPRKASATSQRLRELREFLEQGRSYDKKQIVAVIREEIGLEKTRAYDLVRQAVARRILHYNKQIDTYALV